MRRRCAAAPGATRRRPRRRHRAGGAAAAAAAGRRRRRRRAGGFFAALRPLGQVFEGYLVCEGRDQLVLIDQHAAHERVTFERLRAAYASGLVPRQQLLVPAVVEVGPREAALLGEQVDTLDARGLRDRALRRRRVRGARGAGAARRQRRGRSAARRRRRSGRRRPLAPRRPRPPRRCSPRLACHSAVRVGQSMGPAQIRALLHGDGRGRLLRQLPARAPGVPGAVARRPRALVPENLKKIFTTEARRHGDVSDGSRVSVPPW